LTKLSGALSALDRMIPGRGQQIFQEGRIDVRIGVIAIRVLGPSSIEIRRGDQIPQLAKIIPPAFGDATCYAERLGVTTTLVILDESKSRLQQIQGLVVPGRNTEFIILAC